MSNENKSSAGVVLLAWIFVGVPLAWGIYNTVLNSMKLFRPPVPPPHAYRIQRDQAATERRVA